VSDANAVILEISVGVSHDSFDDLDIDSTFTSRSSMAWTLAGTSFRAYVASKIRATLSWMTTDLPGRDGAGRGKQAVIYLRVSTKGQAETDYSDEGFSIPAQREACIRKAETLGATVVEDGEYLDRGESAKSADRPALIALLQRLQHVRDIDYVIVHKLDRLTRSREDDVQINIAVRAAGASLVSCSENIDETPSGKLLPGIMSAIEEHYSANLAAEARKDMRQKSVRHLTPAAARPTSSGA
jgi:DNA invertase Pin-like site-specific DNA recombinase